MLLAADIFFKTTDCLRFDKSTCFPPGHKNYQITHSGLDAQVCHLKAAEIGAFLAHHTSQITSQGVT
jgi:hypothetical protein